MLSLYICRLCCIFLHLLSLYVAISSDLLWCLLWCSSFLIKSNFHCCTLMCMFHYLNSARYECFCVFYNDWNLSVILTIIIRKSALPMYISDRQLWSTEWWSSAGHTEHHSQLVRWDTVCSGHNWTCCHPTFFWGGAAMWNWGMWLASCLLWLVVPRQIWCTVTDGCLMLSVWITFTAAFESDQFHWLERW